MLLHVYKVKRYVTCRIQLKWILGDLIGQMEGKGKKFSCDHCGINCHMYRLEAGVKNR